MVGVLLKLMDEGGNKCVFVIVVINWFDIFDFVLWCFGWFDKEIEIGDYYF